MIDYIDAISSRMEIHGLHIFKAPKRHHARSAINTTHAERSVVSAGRGHSGISEICEIYKYLNFTQKQLHEPNPIRKLQEIVVGPDVESVRVCYKINHIRFY